MNNFFPIFVDEGRLVKSVFIYTGSVNTFHTSAIFLDSKSALGFTTRIESSRPMRSRVIPFSVALALANKDAVAHI